MLQNDIVASASRYRFVYHAQTHYVCAYVLLYKPVDTRSLLTCPHVCAHATFFLPIKRNPVPNVWLFS